MCIIILDENIHSRLVVILFFLLKSHNRIRPEHDICKLVALKRAVLKVCA
jgi:hypothetical protein